MADSVEIKWAGGTCARAFHDVEINHGGFNAGMSQEGLNGADVGAGLKEMSGEGMTHGVAGGAFGNGGFAHCVLELALQGDFMEVMTGDAVGLRVRAERGGREEVLPWH